MKEMTVRNVTFGTGIPKICVPIVGKTEEEILCRQNILSIFRQIWQNGERIGIKSGKILTA